MSLGWFYDVSTDGKRFVVLNQDPRRGCRAPGARGQPGLRSLGNSDAERGRGPRS
jgi:hypothetical protein